ncbi:MAG: T9SS type A sorting domain-containing protein, partial [Bacteroidia bacterium]|nr:T9SS type A sorting domain-containing protein [Bacteroidia bacterium]
VKVSAVIEAVVAGTPFTGFFRQISDAQFAVTGGHLKMINNTYYLVGGNRFDGDYNPMGHSTYTQVYTDAIRKFNLEDDGTTLTVTHLPTITDAANLHRRDYNAAPHITPNGAEGISVFSGVFQPTVNLPFLSSVSIDSVGYALDSNFQQYYNHYHCAVLPLYSALTQEMHTVFFGGIAQYYDSAGVLVQDNQVPFTSTIARVTRGADGALAEYKLPEEMPALLGASAEFIPLTQIPAYRNEVMKLDELPQDSTLVGYIYGGISSTARNVFFTNTGTQSSASNQIFRVYVIKTETTGLDQLNEHSTGSLRLQVFPNPNEGEFAVKFQLTKVEPAKISIFAMDGKKLSEETLSNLHPGENTYRPNLQGVNVRQNLIILVETPSETAMQKVVIQPRGHR